MTQTQKGALFLVYVVMPIFICYTVAAGGG